MPVNRPEMLRQAAAGVEAVAFTLDRSENPCPHCGTSRKANWMENQMAVELEAVVRKLRNFAAQLDRPENL